MASNIINTVSNNRCNKCDKHIATNKALYCKICNEWFHLKCIAFCQADFQNANNFYSCTKPSHLDLLPTFDVLSKLSSIPNLPYFDNENMVHNPIN